MSSRITRRDAILGAAALTAGAALNSPVAALAQQKQPLPDRSLIADAPAREPFKYCLNTSTIRGGKLPLMEIIDVAADAGWQAIEPWISEIKKSAESGVSAADVRKKLKDRGLTVESSIGFADWIVDDDAKRAAGLESLKKDMALVAEIGGKRIAAPPVGATKERMTDLDKIAERYAAVIELGERMGVKPQMEVWGFSATLSNLAEVLDVSARVGRSGVILLPDIYHLYKGGSKFEALQLVAGSAMECFHVNDYPDMPRDKINDADRVYPGDGVAPVAVVLQTLAAVGFRGAISLELFNPNYEKLDPRVVAKTGFEKTRAAVLGAFATGPANPTAQ